jgi:hypothetical protein
MTIKNFEMKRLLWIIQWALITSVLLKEKQKEQTGPEEKSM